MTFFYKDQIKAVGGKWHPEMPATETGATSSQPNYPSLKIGCWDIFIGKAPFLLDLLHAEDLRLKKLSTSSSSAETDLEELCKSMSIHMWPNKDKSVFYFSGSKTRYYKLAFKPYGRLKLVKIEDGNDDEKEGIWRWEIPTLRLPDLLKAIKSLKAERSTKARELAEDRRLLELDTRQHYPFFQDIRPVVDSVTVEFENEMKILHYEDKPYGQYGHYYNAYVWVILPGSKSVCRLNVFHMPRGVDEAVPIAEAYLDRLRNTLIRIESQAGMRLPRSTIVKLNQGESVPKNEIIDELNWTVYVHLQAMLVRTEENYD